MKEYIKLCCEKHQQHLFYVYISNKTGRINTVCQMCEDEIISELNTQAQETQT